MRIAMFTNTYLPHVGGVARSTSTLTAGLRAAGHEVLVVAPEYDEPADDGPARKDGGEADHPDLVRVAAVQRFAGSDFAMPLPLSVSLEETLDDFDPEIIHSHHPFLLGDTALRAAAGRRLPIVFTYHTRYDLYGHYVAGDGPFMRRMIRSMSAGYCNLCDAVIAPSRSTARQLLDLDVIRPVRVIPSGIELADYEGGDGAALRVELGIPDMAFVIGHVGRLAEEKNLGYLTDALVHMLHRHPIAYLLVAGDGDMRAEIEEAFAREGLGGQVRFMGTTTGRRLADAYAASDVFAFTSHSETQGLVLVEAMAAGLPVVALDAPGAREVVRDGVNGRLLRADTDAVAFADMLEHVLAKRHEWREEMGAEARLTAREYAVGPCVERTLALYRELVAAAPVGRDIEGGAWGVARNVVGEEMRIIGNVAHAVRTAITTRDEDRDC